MSRQPRFEVVRSDDGWHARFRAANGRIVWTTEVYTRRSKAIRAIELVTTKDVFWIGDSAWLYLHRSMEVRLIDERGATS